MPASPTPRSAPRSAPTSPSPGPAGGSSSKLSEIVSALVALLTVAIAYHVLRQRRIGVASAVIADPERSTTMADSGAVRSVQAADLRLPNAALDAIWTPMHLERLARTYWRFLERISLGLIRVSYTPDGRSIVLLFKPLRLLSFHVPEYEMSGERGRVRWRIRDGILVARAGRGEGYLQIDVRRDPPGADGMATAHVEVEVANFYPSIASSFGTWLYQETQSRIHVLVTHRFLRSLARLDLAESRVGAYRDQTAPMSVDDVPDPGTLRPTEAAAATQ